MIGSKAQAKLNVLAIGKQPLELSLLRKWVVAQFKQARLSKVELALGTCD